MRFLIVTFFWIVGSLNLYSQTVANTVFRLLKQQKLDSICLMLDSTHMSSSVLNEQKTKLKTNLTKYGKAKKLIAILNDDAGTKQRYALIIQFKKGKKNLNLLVNSNQKIERINITDFNDTPFYQLKGYKGFSEVTDLTTQIMCADGFMLGANFAFGDTTKQKTPVVIFVHGSGVSDRNEAIGKNKPFKDLAQGLAQQGIASLRYDKRGYDYIKLSQKQIDSIDIYSETIYDAIDAVKTLKQFTFIDTNKIYIVGHSLGAMCAPKIAELCANVKGIVMLAGPAKNLVDILPQQAKDIALLDDSISNVEQMQINQSKWFADKLKDDKEAEKLPYKALGLVSYEYWQSILNFNQIKHAQNLNKPMLILNGENDFQVNMSEFNLWKVELANKKNVQFKSYPKLNHLFMETIGERGLTEYDVPNHIPQMVIDDIAKFIKE